MLTRDAHNKNFLLRVYKKYFHLSSALPPTTSPVAKPQPPRNYRCERSERTASMHSLQQKVFRVVFPVDDDQSTIRSVVDDHHEPPTTLKNISSSLRDGPPSLTMTYEGHPTILSMTFFNDSVVEKVSRAHATLCILCHALTLTSRCRSGSGVHVAGAPPASRATRFASGLRQTHAPPRHDVASYHRSLSLGPLTGP